MVLRTSKAFGDRTARQLADALSISDGETIDSSMFAVSRSFAFDSESADEFRPWYLRSQCFSKFDDGSAATSKQRDQAAFAGFFKVEEECRQTNGRLVDVWNRARVNVKLIRRARAIVARILGRFSWEEFPYACSFGPGASSGLPRKLAFHQNKWELSSHITERAIPYHRAFVKWAGDLPVPDELLVVEGNRVTTVPKDWKKNRVIAIEPDWNMFYQKGLGRMIRRRLQRWKQLLPDAQEKNRALARLGSWTGHLATLDMSNASDSVSLALGEALLPDDWGFVVFDLRSPSGVCDGIPVTYEKISSMGNGSTFELETLFFYALTLAASSKDEWINVSVYGDDIICATESAERVVSLLTDCGFTVNDDKSFRAGPFRESCGGHYWRGTDVTPFYLKRFPDTVGDLVVLGNAIVKWCVSDRRDSLGEFGPVYHSLRREIPRSLRGPYGLDGCLWGNWDECQPKWNRDYQSYSQKIVVRSGSRSDLTDRCGAYLHKLWVNEPELEASHLSFATAKWREQTVQVDREQWSMLKVRLA